MTNSMNAMDIKEILKILPHRYPFLMIDRVLDYEAGKTLTALKNISVNEPMFTGHFPEIPVFPGVLVMEAFAQAAGILTSTVASSVLEDGNLFYFAGIDKARFKNPVLPGDQLIIKVELITHKRNLWKFNANAFVDDKLTASAVVMCATGKA